MDFKQESILGVCIDWLAVSNILRTKQNIDRQFVKLWGKIQNNKSFMQYWAEEFYVWQYKHQKMFESKSTFSGNCCFQKFLFEHYGQQHILAIDSTENQFHIGGPFDSCTYSTSWLLHNVWHFLARFVVNLFFLKS